MTVATFVARYDTTCPGCGGRLAAGTTGGFVSQHKSAVCQGCLNDPPPLPAAPSGPSAPPSAASAKASTPDVADGTLMPHQVAGVGWLHEHPRALLADAPGLGKTIQAGTYVSELLDESPRGARALWLTEAALINQTNAELTRWFPGLPVAATTDAAFASRPTKKASKAFADRFPDGPKLLVASYEFANNRLADTAERYALLVLDEATAIKGGRRTYETVRHLGQRSDRAVALTATPLETNPTEAWSILSALPTPGLWPKDEFERDFVSWTEAYQLPNGQWVDAKPDGFLPGRDAIFREYVAEFCLRRTAAEVGLSLPERVGEAHRLVPLLWEQQKEYDRAQSISGLYGHHRRERAARMSSGGVSSLVTEGVAEVVRRKGEKVVMYAESLKLLSKLADCLREAQIRFVSIEGKDDKASRDSAVATFLTPGSGIDVLIGSRVIEYGLNLQGARVLISLDASYNPAREQQREGRICRIGSPHSTYEHVTLLPDTVLNRRKLQTLRSREFVQLQGGLR